MARPRSRGRHRVGRRCRRIRGRRLIGAVGALLQLHVLDRNREIAAQQLDRRLVLFVEPVAFLALDAENADELAAHGLSATIADARFMKPLDEELVLKLAREHEILITIEEGSIGGFGSHVMQYLLEQGMLDNGMLRVRSMVLPDEFLDHDAPAAMYARAGLDAKSIVAKVFEALGKDFKTETVKLA